jgi:hypothetical protein
MRSRGQATTPGKDGSAERIHINVLVRTFQYIDAVTVDTPIIDDDARFAIRDVFAIKDRLERCKVFVDYLDRCSKTLQDAGAQQYWRDVYMAINNNISAIKMSLRS